MISFPQIPFFMSMFIGLRGMCNLPVETLMVGGLGWFEDLTVKDPYYALPMITALTLGAQIKLGVDGMGTNVTSPLVKKVQYAIPFVVGLFMLNFPSVSWFRTFS